ncbi:MAG: hypothetical protein ACT4OI_04315 [Methanobacteriota archaeon]
MTSVPGRTLVATFGFDERRVLPALRLLSYDELVLITGRPSLRTDGFARLRTLEPSLRTVVVDPFDLVDCLATTAATLRDLARAGRTVRLSVTGGTKILAAAALLAAFQEGVEAWFCDPEPVRLPILRGVRVADAVSASARVLAQALRGPVSAERLVSGAAGHGTTARETEAALGELVAFGLAEAALERGKAVVRPTAALEAFRPHLHPPVARKA